jgi:hypothetical protein
MDRQRVILRYLDGSRVRGYIEDFTMSEKVAFVEEGSPEKRTVGLDDLKAIFFVKTFEGNRSYSEKKTFIDTASLGKRVFVKFKDGESMTGYIEGGVPWEKGFFLEQVKGPGFFLIPVDHDSNNMKVFVVASSVWDVTVMG